MTKKVIRNFSELVDIFPAEIENFRNFSTERVAFEVFAPGGTFARYAIVSLQQV